MPSNGEGATIKGIELGYRQTFDNLPAPFDGLGVQTSFTYADSDAEYSNAGGASYGLYRGAKAGVNYLQSEHSPQQYNQGGVVPPQAVNQYGVPQRFT